MSELWDAYTREGEKTGEILVRDEPIPAGRYHLVSEVLVRHTDGSYLCMIRSRQKPNYPLYPECTAGGSALMGESPLDCIRRELREETGIEWEDFEEVAFSIRDDDRCLICHRSDTPSFHSIRASAPCIRGSSGRSAEAPQIPPR